MKELWETLDQIVQYKREHGYAPTVRELCELCGVASTNTIYKRLVRMEERGMIARTPRSARSIIAMDRDAGYLGQMRARP